MLGLSLAAAGCGNGEEADPTAQLCRDVDPPCVGLGAERSSQEDVLEAFIGASEGTTIVLGEGRFALDRELSLSADNATVRGQGEEQTVLSFAEQEEGHGIFVTGDDFLIEDLTIQDTAQNGIEIRGTTGIVLRRITAEWTADPAELAREALADEAGSEAQALASPFGRYAVYPTSCRHVLIEEVTARRAQDAGIYVGSCDDAVLRDNHAEENVSGIQVENTRRADVYGNTAVGNTLGMLVHDLPGQLPNPNGDQTRVFDNRFEDNNFENFSLPADLTANIPTGTGMLVLARGNVEVYDNRIAGNDTVNLSINSFFLSEPDFEAQEGSLEEVYYPYPFNLHIHGNELEGGGERPDANPERPMAQMLASLLERDDIERIGDIIYDGIVDPARAAENGDPNPMRICIDQPGALLFDLAIDRQQLQAGDLPALAEGVQVLGADDEALRCEDDFLEAHFPLPAVELDYRAGAEAN